MKTNLLLIGSGTILSSMTISGFLLGYVSDYFFNTTPLFLFIFAIIGFIGGMIRVKKMLVKNTPVISKDYLKSDKNNSN